MVRSGMKGTRREMSFFLAKGSGARDPSFQKLVSPLLLWRVVLACGRRCLLWGPVLGRPGRVTQPLSHDHARQRASVGVMTPRARVRRL